MPKITLDDIEYNTEDLSEKGHATLDSLKFVEGQIKKLNNEILVYNTAKHTLLLTLKAEITASGVEALRSGSLPEE